MANYNPRHVYVVSFDSANTDLYYFCSHDDIVLSGVAAANIFSGVLVDPSTTSQTLNPIRANATIGNISFSFIDQSNALTQLLNTKLTSSPAQGLRAKRVQHWVGEEGAEWSSGYSLLQTHQFYNSIGWKDNAYQFNAQDIQRSELADIFDPKKTTLTASLGLTGTTINLNSTTAFSTVQHGGGYSDAPNSAVAYLKIQDEIIRCSSFPTGTTATIDNVSSTLSGAAAANDTTLPITDHSSFGESGNGYVVSGSPQVEYAIKWTGKSASPHQLTGVTGVTAAFDSGSTIYDLRGRGALGTAIAEHNVDTNQSADKRTKVEEYIYLEMPAVQMLYAILTGAVYGASPATTLPSHWHLGIDASQWVATSEFLTIGSDLWDTSDDTAGFPLRFEGLKKTNAKKFIESEILFICGLYTPILPTGELGLRRMSGVVSDSAYSRVLDESNIISIDSIQYNLDDIHNDFLVKWNYDAITENYTREVILTDSDSISKWGQAKQLEIKSLGLKGSSHTDSIIGNLFNTWRDRYAGPPFNASIQLDYSQRDIRIGDIVRLKVSNIPEFTDQNSAYGSLDISVEVQKLSINYRTGVVTIGVFGSTQRAAPLVIGNPSLDDTFYTSEGSDLGAMAISSPLGIVATDSAGTLTFTGNSTLTGVADLNSATATSDNQQGIFYYDGDITINSGVTVTIDNNVEIRCSGTFTNNGTIDGSGGGHAGTATDAGTSGYIGTTRAGGGATIIKGNESLPARLASSQQSTTSGSFSTVGPFNIVNNDTSVSGKPGDLRGTSGGKGGDMVLTKSALTGGNGGAGGGGLIIFCRGAVGGANSSINLSGADGTVGATDGTFASGTGAGGYPGGLVVVLDGNTVTETISPYLTANLGNSDTIGHVLQEADWTVSAIDPLLPIYSYYSGFQTENKASSGLYVHYLTENQTAAVDTPSTSTLPTAITVSEHSNTQNSVNVLGLEISATAPSDTNYKAARLYIKRRSTEGWHYAGEAASGQEVVFWVAADGAAYDIKAHSLSNTNVESTDYIERTYTVSTGTTTQLGTGTTIISGNAVETNGGLLISGNDLIVYDSSGNVVQTIDLSGSGNFTGTGTMSGSAADEQLVPNNNFDFYNSSGNPDGWVARITVSASPAPVAIVYQDSPLTEGNYLNLPNVSGGSHYVISKTYKLFPDTKYRVRIRTKHSGAGSPTIQDGMAFTLLELDSSKGFIENLDTASTSFQTLISASSKLVTDSFATYSYDVTTSSGVGWGSLKISNTSASDVDFQIAWVDVLPWGIISNTDIGIFINDTTFGNQGIQLDYNSGTPRMYVGNGDKKFLKFDGTDLSIGEDGSLLGAADYSDDSTFIYYPLFTSTDGWSLSTGGAGTTPYVSAGLLWVGCPSNSVSDSSSAQLVSWNILHVDTWGTNRKFKCKVRTATPASLNADHAAYIMTGDYNTNGFGFFYDNGTWKTRTVSSGASTDTTISGSISNGDYIEAILDNTTSPREVRFYVDGVLTNTHTTNIPSAGSSSNVTHMVYVRVEATSASSPQNSTVIAIGEFKLLLGY